MTTLLKIKRLQSHQADFNQQLDILLRRDVDVDAGIETTVSEIIQAVRQQGDSAVVAYTKKFDRFDVSEKSLELPQNQLHQALERIDVSQRQSLEFAAQRVRDYHQHQLQESWSFTEDNGNRLGQKVTPLARVGLYVPGGKAAYPSSVLMNAIPAKVAGVSELIMVTPNARW